MAGGSHPPGAPDYSIAGVLRLLSSPAGAIILALGEGPLRTRRLVERVQRAQGVAPRTIYRHLEALEAFGLVSRTEEPGAVPSRVTYRLSRPAGCHLNHLVQAFAGAAPSGGPERQLESREWERLALLAELMEQGIVDALSCEQLSPTELARRLPALSLHQIGRRANLFSAAGLLRERRGAGRNKRYELTNLTRRHMALVAALIRWRRRHVDDRGAGAETAIALRVALPLVRLPEQIGKLVAFAVLAEDGDEVTFWARVERQGLISCGKGAAAGADGQVRGTSATWLAALLDGKRGKFQVGGCGTLVDAYLKGLHQRLSDDGRGR